MKEGTSSGTVGSGQWQWAAAGESLGWNRLDWTGLGWAGLG